MARFHQIEDIRIKHGTMTLVVDGQQISKSLAELSPALARASEQELGAFEISPAGYGIHWPLIDEDVSIDGLLGVSHAPPEWKEPA